MSRLSFYWNADDDIEDIKHYTIGGYHPISLGEVLSSPSCQYRVLHKLGRGAFATVWLAESIQGPSYSYVALKICAADVHPKRELDIYKKIPSEAIPNIVRLLDSFTLQGPNGLHNVFVHDVLGSLTSVIAFPDSHKYTRSLCQQIARGVAALHRNNVVHGDLHTGNVGIALPTLDNHSPRDVLDHFGNPECTIILPTQQPTHPKALPPYLVSAISLVDYFHENDPSFLKSPPQVKLMDLGSGMIIGEESGPSCTPAAVCAPELMFERVVHSVDPSPTPPSDIWSLACTIYEIVFRTSLFHFAAPNDALLGTMAALCGEVPASWKSYWSERERLRSMEISHDVANAEWQRRLEHYTQKMPGDEVQAAQIIGLLRSMLKMDPKQRLTAEEALRHPWFARSDTFE
ncbi:hypothetical protein H0H92_013754 [Tricholoma furcatifolium]|nr:hypothetical protein H0H92_013754 [Tricholoma furcatifolium]